MPEPITASAFGVKAIFSSTVIAGLLGALVSLQFLSHMKGWERLTAFVSGWVIACYVAPVVSYFLGIEQFQGPVGFMVGIYGMSITAAIYEAIKKADPWGLIMSRWGRNGSSGE